MADTKSTIGSIVSGVISGIKNGLFGLFTKLFVADGYITTTEKPESKEVKKELNSKDSNLTGKIQLLWDNLEETIDAAGDAWSKAISAARLTLADLFWNNWVSTWEDIKSDYSKYWKAQSRQFNPKKEPDYEVQINDKNGRIKIDLARFAAAIPGFEIILETKDILLEFCKFVADYEDPFSPSNNAGDAIAAMVKSIKQILTLFMPFGDYLPKSFFESINLGWNDLLLVLLALAATDEEMSGKESKVKKDKKYRRPKLPHEITEAFEAAKDALSSLGKKMFMFIFWIIFKMLEAVVKLFELLGLDVIPPLNLIVNMYKMVLTGWKLFTEGPLAIKSIFWGIGSKIAGLFDEGAFLDSLPDNIDFEIAGFDLGGVETEYTVTLSDFDATSSELASVASEMNLVQAQITYMETAESRGVTFTAELSAKLASLKSRLEELNSESAFLAKDMQLMKLIAEENNAKLDSAITQSQNAINQSILRADELQKLINREKLILDSLSENIRKETAIQKTIEKYLDKDELLTNETIKEQKAKIEEYSRKYTDTTETIAALQADLKSTQNKTDIAYASATEALNKYKNNFVDTSYTTHTNIHSSNVIFGNNTKSTLTGNSDSNNENITVVK